MSCMSPVKIPDEPEEPIKIDHGKTFLTVRLKKGIQRRNILYILLLSFLSDVCLNDRMGLEQPLLEDPNYYGLTSQEAVNLQSQAQSYQTIPSMIMLLLVGAIMDKFGRRSLMTLMVLGWSITLAIMPLLAPNKLLFIANTMSLNLFYLPMMYNPLTQDYVHKDSLGRMLTLSSMAALVGLIFGLLVVFEYSKDIDPLYAYAVMGVIGIFLTITTVFMVCEPKDVQF